MPMTPTQAEAIEKRARKLLDQWLSPEQKKMFKGRKYFYVVSKDRRVFALFDGFQVIGMFDGKPHISYHVFATDPEMEEQLPAGDSILTQMLFLQTNPVALLQKACCNDIHRVPPDLRRGVGCPPMAGGLLHEK